MKTNPLLEDPRRAVQVLRRIIRKQRVTPRMARAALASLYGDSDPEFAMPVGTEHDVLIAFFELVRESGGTPNNVEIAERAGLAPSTTSTKLHRLEQILMLERRVKASQVARNFRLTDKAYTYIQENN